MFIIEADDFKSASRELRGVFKMIQKELGFIPPHLELFATIDKSALIEFVAYQRSMMHHRAIDAALLPFLRLYIAHKEQRTYCQDFNAKLLRSKDVDGTVIDNIATSIKEIPVAENQRILAQEVLNALYNTDTFTTENIIKLERLGFSHKDFFDLLNYCCSFMSKSKMIEIYLQKKTKSVS